MSDSQSLYILGRGGTVDVLHTIHRRDQLMIAVLGATGNTGSRIATTLLDRGHAVRVIARSADKLASLAARGADPVATDLTDAGAMSAALRGADAVYTM